MNILNSPRSKYVKSSHDELPYFTIFVLIWFESPIYKVTSFGYNRDFFNNQFANQIYNICLKINMEIYYDVLDMV